MSALTRSGRGWISAKTLRTRRISSTNPPRRKSTRCPPITLIRDRMGAALPSSNIGACRPLKDERVSSSYCQRTMLL